MTSYNPQRSQLLMTHKDVGMVAEVFHQNHRDEYAKLMEQLKGRAAIGHVRYATSGREDRNYAHPFERPHIKRNKWFSFAFNGQLANYEFLKADLLAMDPNAWFARESDSEIFMHYLCLALKDSERDLLKICQKMTRPHKDVTLDGAYSETEDGEVRGNTVRLHARDEVADGTLAHGHEIIGSMARVPFIFIAVLSLGFVAMIVASADARRREFRVLRAVGATRAYLARVLAQEALAVAALGLAFGFAGGTVAGVLFTIPTRAIWSLPVLFALPVATVAKGAAGAVACALAVAVPTALAVVREERA